MNRSLVMSSFIVLASSLSFACSGGPEDPTGTATSNIGVDPRECPASGQNISSYAQKHAGGRGYNTVLTVGVTVRNIDYNKRVGIVYTTDGWQTSHVKDLEFKNGQVQSFRCNGDNVEQWGLPEFQFEVAPAQSFPQTQVIYAAFFEDLDSGSTYWDNNGGRNYVVGE